MSEARASLFKGGTSLSKAFGLIPRFSEDIDITVFREDIGQAVETAALDALSGKQRRIRLDAIRESCKAYINGPLAARLAQHAAAIGGGRMRLAHLSQLGSDTTAKCLIYIGAGP
jgi:ribosomal protein RSM22 (predicted rRNA methylase)